MPVPVRREFDKEMVAAALPGFARAHSEGGHRGARIVIGTVVTGEVAIGLTPLPNVPTRVYLYVLRPKSAKRL